MTPAVTLHSEPADAVPVLVDFLPVMVDALPILVNTISVLLDDILYTGKYSPILFFPFCLCCQWASFRLGEFKCLK